MAEDIRIGVFVCDCGSNIAGYLDVKDLTMQILIKSGTLITASETYIADIFVEGERIAMVGANLDIPEAQIIDAHGKLVMPGGIDPHTHFDLPMFGTVSSDDHYTGHKAAAFGGTTTVIDFVPQGRSTLEESVEAWRVKADPKAAIDFSFHMNLSHLDERIAAEIPHLPDLGITTLKVFTAYNSRLRLQDGEIFRALRIAGENGLLTLVHAENGDVIDILVGEAVANGLTTPEWHAHTRPAWGAVTISANGSYQGNPSLKPCKRILEAALERTRVSRGE